MATGDSSVTRHEFTDLNKQQNEPRIAQDTYVIPTILKLRILRFSQTIRT